MQKMQKNKTAKQKCKAIISVLLMAVILIVGAFAFLTAKDSKTNVFTVGNVNIELWEEFDTNHNNSIEDDEIYNKDESAPKMEKDIAPGDTIIKKPYVKNTGVNDAWIYMTVAVPTATNEQLARGATNNEAGIMKTQELVVKAYAIQDGFVNYSTALDIWNAYFNENAAEMNFGNQSSTETKELFALDDIDTDNWSSFTYSNGTFSESNTITPYYSDNGYAYYVFSYGKLAHKAADAAVDDAFPQTTDLFASVTLTNAIGSSSSSGSGSGSDSGGQTSAKTPIKIETTVPDTSLYLTNLTTFSISDYSGATFYNPGESFPTPAVGDVFVDGDYEYKYGYVYDSVMNGWVPYIYGEGDDTCLNGWCPRVLDTSKSSYHDIPDYINGIPVTSIFGTFKDCSNLTTSPKIPDTVVNMTGAFYDCINLTTAPLLPANLKHLDAETFYDTNITSLTIPEGVTRIHESSFGNCTNLKTIYIPSTVTQIDANVFSEYFLDSLTDIYFNGSEEQWNAIHFGNEYGNYGNAKLNSVTIHFN